MESMAFTFGLTGFVFGLIAFVRVGNLEKKLKQFDVIPRDFNSERDQPEGKSE